MRFNLNWLKEYVDITADAETLGEALTMLGFPLEGIHAEGGDTVIELDITMNRPDVLNHIGLARELAAKFSLPLRLPSQKYSAEERVPVTIESPELCPRYSARLIKNVKNAPSPKWLTERLESVGLRSINGVVDITNYVLMEMGHPLHAFDYAKLKNGEIVVRKARAGETITTLDGKQHKLSPAMLVIADAKVPVALAGIMGGLETEVGFSAKEILLESAYFDPLTIRRGSKSLALKTEASVRFERGADYSVTVRAIDRATELILKNFGGEVVADADVRAKEIKPRSATLRFGRLKALLGSAPGLESEWIKNLLEGLGFKISHCAQDKLTVEIPPWRGDVERECDLIEEVARHYGYGRIISDIAFLPEPSAGRAPAERMNAKLRNVLSQAGCQEVISYSMTDIKLDSACGTNEKFYLHLANPLSEDAGVLKQSPWTGLLSAFARNLNIGCENLRLYEIGNIFIRQPNPSPDNPIGSVREEPILAVLATGDRHPKHWSAQSDAFDFYDMRALAETIFDELKIAGYDFIPVKSPMFLDGEVAKITADGEDIGAVGAMCPNALKAFGIEDVKIFGLHIYLSAVEKKIPSEFKVGLLPKLLSVRRDLAFLADKDCEFSRINDILKNKSWPYVKKIALVDLYEGPAVPAGKKSFAFAIEFQPEERNLTESDLLEIERDIVQFLADKVGLELRGELK